MKLTNRQTAFAILGIVAALLIVCGHPAYLGGVGILGIIAAVNNLD